MMHGHRLDHTDAVAALLARPRHHVAVVLVRVVLAGDAHQEPVADLPELDKSSPVTKNLLDLLDRRGHAGTPDAKLTDADLRR